MNSASNEGKFLDLKYIYRGHPTREPFSFFIQQHNKPYPTNIPYLTFTSTSTRCLLPRDLSRNVNPPTQPFQSNSATLEYNSVESLGGFQQFNGIIGSGNEVSFTFSDGTAIKGPLDIPVNPASQVSGTGSWSLS
ncbi:hypothetical protein AU210_014220 [Fusarium oxysporum f. sp. radicis-cucumerinum]|uniref:Uncharacterized protein n=1 Tax=Fusarium oxysporum f. sp. radicis-cucumerinum TaxID=327505 RepID=A0A2H3GBK2_FUSOX|nr:hypothetical protein AU210_014220 [Fusarium oxysporum f. sp. radicis-cucumerinum]